MDRSGRLLDDLTKFSRRAMDDVYRISESPIALSRNMVDKDNGTEEEPDQPELIFNGLNLYNQGGVAFVEKALNIVKVRMKMSNENSVLTPKNFWIPKTVELLLTRRGLSSIKEPSNLFSQTSILMNYIAIH